MARHPLLGSTTPFTLSHALASGLDEERLRRALRRSELRRLWRGVYVPERVPDTVETRACALRLVASHAVVSHESAATVWGVDVGGRPGTGSAVLRVTVPPGRPRPQLAGVAVTSTPDRAR